jgi:hypothetical protein
MMVAPTGNVLVPKGGIPRRRWYKPHGNLKNCTEHYKINEVLYQEDKMNREELQKFCDPDHPKICGPFSFGDFSYASNGHLLVKVPRLDDVPEWEALNEKASKLFDSFDYSVVIPSLIDIPRFPQPKPEPCGVCNGTGKITRCPECEGKGEVEFETEYNDYSCECETCHGHGSVIGEEQICACCNGTGKKKEMKMIEVGCSGFSSHYLTLLNKLPGIKIAPTEPEKMTYFKWDGGEGAIMPMRR